MCKVTDSGSSTPTVGAANPLVVMEGINHSGIVNAKLRQRVRFGDNVEHVFEKDFTDADLPYMWYNDVEFLAIKSEIYDMIRSIRQMENPQRWHWRGFEHIQHRRSRKEIHRLHSSELLFFQNAICADDPVGLGLLAVSSSRESSKRARELAIQDEYEAFEIYNEKEQDDIDAIPDTESATECSGSDGDDFLLPQTMPPLTVCRMESDDKMIHLLQRLPHSSSTESESVISTLYFPLKFVLMLFPCIC